MPDERAELARLRHQVANYRRVLMEVLRYIGPPPGQGVTHQVLKLNIREVLKEDHGFDRKIRR